MEKVLKVQDLEKKYKNGRGVSDVSFYILQGEVIGLLGPNGSGKTTIMKAITGLVGVDKGIIEICGTNLVENFEDAIKNVGCLIETPSLIGNMTCYNNLKFVSRFYKNIDPERINVVLGMVGLTKYKNDRVKSFSLGMKQRLAIAMAILHNPALIILDEPSNGLDIEGSKELRKIISNLTKEYMVSFLISSHQIHEIQMICDKLIIIKDGRIVDTCIVKDEKFKEVSIEDYYINCIK